MNSVKIFLFTFTLAITCIDSWDSAILGESWSIISSLFLEHSEDSINLLFSDCGFLFVGTEELFPSFLFFSSVEFLVSEIQRMAQLTTTAAAALTPSSSRTC
jgi:hypothetical protein